MEILINQVYMCDCGRLRMKEFDVRQGLICFNCGSVPKLSGQATLGIYTMIPFEVEVKSEDKDRILDLLISNKGFIKASDIALRLNLKADKTSVNVRKAVSLLISDGFPIVSTGKGFCFVSSYDKIKAYMDSLESRRSGLNRRIDQLQKIYNTLKEEGKIDGCLYS